MSLADIAAPPGPPAPSVRHLPSASRQRLRRAVMRQRWEQLTFIHLQVSQWELERRLPPGLELDCHQGTAWIGIVPFHLSILPPRLGGPLPLVGRFAETNVRTYVVGPDGPGILFLSLEAGNRAAIAVARATYGLPYRHSSMRIQIDDDSVHYCGSGGGVCEISVRPGGRVERVTDLEDFLTARYRLYSTDRQGRLLTAAVDHRPWPLRRARLLRLHETLLADLGIAALNGERHVLYCDGLEARMGPPRHVRG